MKLVGDMTIRPEKKIIVYTSMVADLFHIGHLRLLERAKALGTHLIVGIITDECVFNYKGRQPIFSQDERLSIISAISYVDQAILQNERDGSTNVTQLGSIDIIVEETT